MQLYTQHDVEKTLASIAATLTDTSKSWDLRVSAVSLKYPVTSTCDNLLLQLKDLRSVTDQEIIDHTHFTMLLKGLEDAISESVRCGWLYAFIPTPPPPFFFFS